MHYHWQVLVTAPDREEAIQKAKDTIDSIGGEGHIWDRYTVGGRWTPEDIPVAINGEHPEFWSRIEEAFKFRKDYESGIVGDILGILEEKGVSLEGIIKNIYPSELVDPRIWWRIREVSELREGVPNTHSYFCVSEDIDTGTDLPDYVKESIKENPKSYWVVTMDLHN